MLLRDKVRLVAHHDWTWLDSRCGHCGNPTNLAHIGGVPLFTMVDRGIPPQELGTQLIAVCVSCAGVNVFIKGTSIQFPPLRLGREVAGLPEDVRGAWEEARAALAANAPVASEHMCRKLLIHIAAGEAKKQCSGFQEAVSALVEARVITEQMKPWVDRIRQNGNDAAHELEKPDGDRAKLTLEFTQQLLQIVYEMKFRLEHSTANRADGDV